MRERKRERATEKNKLKLKSFVNETSQDETKPHQNANSFFPLKRRKMQIFHRVTKIHQFQNTANATQLKHFESHCLG